MTRWYKTYRSQNRTVPLQHESDIQKTIIEILQIFENMGKLVFIRNNSFAGKFIRPDGSEGYIKNRKKGSSDLIVFISGKTFFLEVKNEKGEFSNDQKNFKNLIEKLGFSYHVVRDVETANRILAPYL